MNFEFCEKRQKILDATGHTLVLGGPGSGKTTIALKKAVRVIDDGLHPGQAVLFISFSRAAVTRLAEASKSEVERAKRHHLSVHTFHSFSWELLRSHGYLVGCPKRRLELLLPHDERALSGGLKPPQKGKAPTTEWTNWTIERLRLFHEEGKITFDLFAPKVVELLNRCPLVLELVSSRYPIIVVDEAQDTGSEAWSCIEILSRRCQVICLGDLDQQIFDHLEGVGPERIAHIQKFLQPLCVDLGGENNRSPGTEISLFGNNVRDSIVRNGPYTGVSRQMYNPKEDAAKRLRIALARAYQAVKKATGSWPESVAILAFTGAGVARISAALNSGERPVRHKILFDEASVVLSARIAAFLLEPKSERNLHADVAICLDLLAAARRAAGGTTSLKEAATYQRWALDISQGKPIKFKIPKAIEALVRSALTLELTGDPGRDWSKVKQILRQSDQEVLSRIASDLDYLVAFNRGKRIAGALSEMWLANGTYVRAREALDAALAEDQLLAGTDDLRGIHLMTIHKSKAKQFDAVIIMREGQALGPRQWQSNAVWRDDSTPYLRSRKILRVGITRAKVHILLLEPFFPTCPILTPYKL